jgi:hypothetical protein
MEQNFFVYWSKSGRNKGNISKSVYHPPRYRMGELVTIKNIQLMDRGNTAFPSGGACPDRVAPLYALLQDAPGGGCAVLGTREEP